MKILILILIGFVAVPASADRPASRHKEFRQVECQTKRYKMLDNGDRKEIRGRKFTGNVSFLFSDDSVYAEVREPDPIAKKLAGEKWASRKMAPDRANAMVKNLTKDADGFFVGYGDSSERSLITVGTKPFPLQQNKNERQVVVIKGRTIAIGIEEKPSILTDQKHMPRERTTCTLKSQADAKDLADLVSPSVSPSQTTASGAVAATDRTQ
jgi:hypothetical protein